MVSLTKLPQPVHWFEGMLLSPQHFQQNNQYFENALFNQLERLCPHFWGVTKVQLNEQALADRKIVIEHLHVVMKDGTVVNYDGDDAAISQPALSLDLSSLVLPNGINEFEIHVAIAQHGEACVSDSNSDMKRYDSINVGRVLDDNDAENSVDLVRLRTRLHLLPYYPDGPAILSNYSHFPIAKITTGSDDSFDLSGYVPPLLFVKGDYALKRGSLSLYKKIDVALGALRKKAMQLKSHFIDHQTDSVIMSGFQRQRIHYLTSNLPMLDSLLRCSKTHPYQMYQALLDAAGNMAVLHEDLIPPLFSAYKHEDIQGCFDAVLEYIYQILDTSRVDFSTVTFQKNSDDEYFSSLSNLTNLEKPTLYLACKVKAGTTRQQLMSWIEEAYIFTNDQRDIMERSRVISAERKQVTEFKTLKIGASEDELLIEATLVLEDGIKEPRDIIIAGSNRALDDYAPHSITWFIDDKCEESDA